MNADASVIDEPQFEAPSSFERNPRAKFEWRDYERARLHRTSSSPMSGIGTQELLTTSSLIGGSFAPSLSASAATALRALYVSARFDFSAKLCQRLGELLNLQAGWDGENAAPPKPEVLANVVSVLVFLKATLPNFREPFLAPTLIGFAQLEWRKDQRSLDVELTSNGWSIVGSERATCGGRLYHEADCARTDINTLVLAYKWLDGTELLWPIP